MAQTPELLNAFVRQGYATYSEAFEAVDLFETEVQRAIAKTFEAKTSWQGVQRRKNGDAFTSLVKNPRSARGISAWVACEARAGETNCAVGLGLSWNTPRLGPGVVAAHAHYWLGRSTRLVSPVSEFVGRVKAGPLAANDHRLYLIVDETFELEEGFALLLEALDSGIAAQNLTIGS